LWDSLYIQRNISMKDNVVTKIIKKKMIVQISLLYLYLVHCKKKCTLLKYLTNTQILNLRCDKKNLKKTQAHSISS